MAYGYNRMHFTIKQAAGCKADSMVKFSRGFCVWRNPLQKPKYPADLLSSSFKLFTAWWGAPAKTTSGLPATVHPQVKEMGQAGWNCWTQY